MKKTLFIAASIMCAAALFARPKGGDERLKTTQAFTQRPVAEKDVMEILTAGIQTASGMNGQPWHFSVVTDALLLDEIDKKMQAFIPAALGGNRNTNERNGVPGAPPPAREQNSGEKDAPPMGNGNPPPPNAVSMSGPKAGIKDAPLAIVVSGTENSNFDCGLAVQSMAITAVELGYGTKIISSPTIVLNGEDKAYYDEKLGVPEGKKVIAVLLVGKKDKTAGDAVTGATPRNAFKDTVTFVR